MRRRFDTCGAHSHPCVTETNEDSGEVIHHDSQEQKDSPIRVAVGRRFDVRVFGAALVASVLVEELLRRLV